MKPKILFETRHGLGEKAMYMLETIGSDAYPLFPLLLPASLGTFKDILERTEELLKEEKGKQESSSPSMVFSSSLFASLIKLLKH